MESTAESRQRFLISYQNVIFSKRNKQC